MLKKIPWLLVAVLIAAGVVLGVAFIRSRAAIAAFKRDYQQLRHQQDVAQWTVGQLGDQLSGARTALDRAQATAAGLAADNTQLIDANRRITDRLAAAGATLTGAESQGTVIAAGLDGDIQLAQRCAQYAIAIRDAVVSLEGSNVQGGRGQPP